jgi:hypothetical protein
MPETEVRNQRAVFLDVLPVEILQQPTTAANHFEEAETAVVIFLVGVEVATKIVDARGKDRDLNRCASDVTFVELVLLNDFSLVGHLDLSLRRSLRYRGSGPNCASLDLAI